jgi:tripartite-type tricarboxylate transporter receptor subunit TctC
MQRKDIVRSALALLALGASLGQAVAQGAYPNRPVKIVVPFATGGPADVYARFIAQRLSDAMGQSFVVDNKPGGGSVIGTDLAAKSPADGYTLLMMSNTHTVNETLIPSKPFALMKDFVGVAPINYSDLVLVAHPSKGINTLGDLLKRAQAEPGKLNYASSGPGTPYHMAGELLKSMARINVVHVPYKGDAPAVADLLAGHVNVMFGNVAQAVKVRATAVAMISRFISVPLITEI